MRYSRAENNAPQERHQSVQCHNMIMHPLSLVVLSFTAALWFVSTFPIGSTRPRQSNSHCYTYCPSNDTVGGPLFFQDGPHYPFGYGELYCTYNDQIGVGHFDYTYCYYIYTTGHLLPWNPPMPSCPPMAIRTCDYG